MTRQARRCTARRSSDGQPCEAYAMSGAAVCHAHGGRAPQTRRRAAERLAEQKARTALSQYSPDAVIIDNPIAELLEAAGEFKALKNFLADRVAEMRADDWRRADAEGSENLRAYERALDRTARVLVELAKLKLEERLVRLTEQQGAMLAVAIQKILDALDLTAEQRARVPEIVPGVLLAIGGGER
ncbi:hypothetical protein [Streptosporangium roseum]|uniref:hypothetical protein n=1 Tax=Streptosporangium roseum TaxID=2001 RepID=UPI0012DE770B|nr:hypothetical protein [Streptosporangium roseum]